jgi:hypothetical protein
MSKPLTWGQALALAAKTEAKKSTVNNYAAVEFGRQLKELQEQARPDPQGLTFEQFLESIK